MKEMKQKNFIKRKEVIILFIFLSVLFFKGELNSVIAIANEPIENGGKSLSYTTHPGFNITNNGNFTDYGLSGTGASDDPFIIENFNITTTETNGIYITGTSVHFVIQNCYIDAASTGIFISNVATNTTRIVNNTLVSNNQYGVRIDSSSDSILLDNYCTNNLNGLFISSSTGAILINNTSDNDSNRGIYLSFVPDSLLVNNTCFNNDYGIYLSSSHNTVVKNNSLIGCWSGLWFTYSDDIELYDNTCEYSPAYGFLLSSCTGISFGYNVIIYSNHGLYVTDNCESATIFNNTISHSTGYSLHLVVCPDSILANNTVSYNYIGLDMVSSSNSVIEHNMFISNEEGNRIGNCPSLTIQNNYFYNDGLEFTISNTSNYLTCTFANNWVNDKELGFFFNLNNLIIQESIYGQLILINCSNIVIYNQILYNTSTGINVYFSEDIIIGENSCYNNNINGIYLYSTTSVTVDNNILLNNYENGIFIRNSAGTVITTNLCSNNTNGIKIDQSPNVIVFNNTCGNNSLYGIYLPGNDLGSPSYKTNVKEAYSDSCLITYNQLITNTEYGIYINTDTNIIYNNSFIDNNLGGTSQAFDAGTGNIWYDTGTNLGNMWSDWISGPYAIDGAAGSFDLYPLFEIPIPPIIAEYPYTGIFLILAIIPFLTVGFILFKRKK